MFNHEEDYENYTTQKMSKETEERENSVTLVGIVKDEPVLSHESYGEKFYGFNLGVQRLSEVEDVLFVLVSDRVYDPILIQKGQSLEILGQIRTFNNQNNMIIQSKSKLIVSVYATEITPVEELTSVKQHKNDVSLVGYICKEPNYRLTPKGREVCDILLAVHRPYSSEVISKSDYLPCICWGKNARYMGQKPVGLMIKAKGKLQSREYQKKISETEFETRTAFEVSISQIREF